MTAKLLWGVERLEGIAAPVSLKHDETDGTRVSR